LFSWTGQPASSRTNARSLESAGLIMTESGGQVARALVAAAWVWLALPGSLLSPVNGSAVVSTSRGACTTWQPGSARKTECASASG